MSTDRDHTTTSSTYTESIQSTQATQSTQSTVEIETASPSRYVWAGIATVLSLIVCCTLAVALLGQGVTRRANVLPTPAPGSGARLEVSGPLAPGSPFGVRGVGFLPGELVEIFVTPSMDASFDRYGRLGEATAGPDGNFQVDTLVAPDAPGDYFLIARGASSGFTQFTPVVIGGAPPPVPTDTPSGEVPTVAPPTFVGPLPDLTIAGVAIELQTGASCAYDSTQLGIRVIVQNIGPASAGPFLVQANNQQQLVQAGLAPGQTASLWFPGYSTGSNVVIVDPTNMVTQGNLGNRQFNGPLPVPTLPPTCTPPPGPTVIIPTSTPNPNPTGAWYAQYFGNPDLVPPVLFDQNLPGPFLNVNWGTGAPGPGVPRNNWSAIFTSNVNFPTIDNYLFTLTVDGGARVYVDDVLIINQWFSGGLRTATANYSVPAGPRNVRVEYYKSGTSARLSLSWQVNYTGWEGRYYNSPNLDGPIIVKRDDPPSPPNPPGFLDSATLVNWPPPGVTPFNFSADWRRTINFPIGGTYIFTAVVDDGVRLFIDGTIVPGIDNFTAGPKTLTGSRVLSAGPRAFQVQYVNYTGPASIKLTWALLPPPPPATPTPTLPPPPTTPTPTPTPTLPPPPATDTPTPTPTLPPPPATDTPTPTPTLPPPPPTPTPTDTPPPPPPTPTPTPTPTPMLIIATPPPPTPPPIIITP